MDPEMGSDIVKQPTVKNCAYQRVSRMEVEGTVALASTHEDVEGLAQMIALLKGELVEAH
jgi:hypothetical protein